MVMPAAVPMTAPAIAMRVRIRHLRTPCSGDAPQGRRAERLKGDWHELDTGHYPMLSQPEQLTRLLLAPLS